MKMTLRQQVAALRREFEQLDTIARRHSRLDTIARGDARGDVERRLKSGDMSPNFIRYGFRGPPPGLQAPPRSRGI